MLHGVVVRGAVRRSGDGPSGLLDQFDFHLTVARAAFSFAVSPQCAASSSASRVRRSASVIRSTASRCPGSAPVVGGQFRGRVTPALPLPYHRPRVPHRPRMMHRRHCHYAQGLGVLRFEAQHRPRIPTALSSAGAVLVPLGGRPRLVDKFLDARRPFFHGALLHSQAFFFRGLSLCFCGAPCGQIVELALEDHTAAPGPRLRFTRCPPRDCRGEASSIPLASLTASSRICCPSAWSAPAPPLPV